MPEARFETIPIFNLYEPTHAGLKPTTKNSLLNYQRKQGDYQQDSFNHFPIILNADGSPWNEANFYLLDKLCGFKRVSSKTLEAKAVDLVMFRRWIDSEEIDYLHFPKRIMARPTYRFCAFLHSLLGRAEIGFSTAKRRMSTVQQYYRWLKNKHNVEFEYPLWREKEVFVNVKDQRGFGFHKLVKSTDISFKQATSEDGFEQVINDGGKLRPLEKQEQYRLVSALKKISNTEMTLAFLLALTTGARMQTIFTFRVGHFEKTVPTDLDYVRITAGHGTTIDTKYGKRIVLLIPVWLYQRIHLYIRSERATKRRNICSHVYENDSLQYLFLTKSGKPYYLAESDPFVSLYRHPPRGISVNAFINQQLKPVLNDSEKPIKFRFHDLRATFGLNLLEDHITQLSSNESDGHNSSHTNSLWPALLSVQKRLGHSSITTTERYLSYRNNYQLALSVQSEFENHLREIVNSHGD